MCENVANFERIYELFYTPVKQISEKRIFVLYVEIIVIVRDNYN